MRLQSLAIGQLRSDRPALGRPPRSPRSGCCASGSRKRRAAEKRAVPQVGNTWFGPGAVVAQRFAGVAPMKIAPAWRSLRPQRCGSALRPPRCSGAMRLLISQASSMLRTWISAPRPSARRDDLGARHRRQQRDRCLLHPLDVAASGLSRILCASSSCSAWRTGPWRSSRGVVPSAARGSRSGRRSCRCRPGRTRALGACHVGVARADDLVDRGTVSVP